MPRHATLTLVLLLPFVNSLSSMLLLGGFRRINRATSLTTSVRLPFAIKHLVPATTTMTTSTSASSDAASSVAAAETKKFPIIPGPKLPPIPATCKRLFLVRHGEVINPGGDKPVFYGGADVPLSDLGKEEANAAAQYLQQFDLTLIVSSPLSRAVFGANQVLALQQRQTSDSASSQSSSSSTHELLILDGLTELNRGAWYGKTKEEIGVKLLQRFDACDESVTPEGGESYPTLKRRVLQARDEVLQRLAPGQAACIVSHLQVTRSILSDAHNIPTKEMAEIKVATASVTCIDYDEDTSTTTGQPQRPIVRYESFKPNLGLAEATDGAN